MTLRTAISDQTTNSEDLLGGNRDAHTYIAHQRRDDFPAVARVFVPAFNILVTTMKKGDHLDAKRLKGTDA